MMNINIQNFNNNYHKVTFKSNEKNNFQSTPKLLKTPSKDSFELSVGYINDAHGQTSNMMRILSGLDGDLRLSGGDNYIGDEKNIKIHNATSKFLNLAKIKVTALGNHELDISQQDFINITKNYDGDILSINYKQKPLSEQTKEDVVKNKYDDLNKTLKKSVVVEVKGEKIGIVGASPMDMLDRLTHPNYYKNSYVEKLDETIKLVQSEVNDLKSKNINKIILLSHMGYSRDKILAQKTEGIDIIIGGHTHELVKDIKEGENLQYSLTGEPVIITQAGRDGNYFGKLNLVFDEEGVITKAQNNLGKTGLFYKNMATECVLGEFLGKPEDIGIIKSAPQPPENLTLENPHANFVCDAMRSETDSDIALWHHCGVRNYFHEGIINSHDLKEMAPFLDYVVTANVSEERLVNMFKEAIEETYEHSNHKPGLIAVSGLTYTVNPKEGELVEMTFIDKNGEKHSIDVNNPRSDKFYKVVTDEFLMSAGADYEILAAEDEYIEKYPYDKDVVACNYIKKLNKPIEINQTGRISYINFDD